MKFTMIRVSTPAPAIMSAFQPEGRRKGYKHVFPLVKHFPVVVYTPSTNIPCRNSLTWPHLTQGRWRYVGFILGSCVPKYTVLMGALWYGKRTSIEGPILRDRNSGFWLFYHLANQESSLPRTLKSSVMFQSAHSLAAAPGSSECHKIKWTGLWADLNCDQTSWSSVGPQIFFLVWWVTKGVRPWV